MPKICPLCKTTMIMYEKERVAEHIYYKYCCSNANCKHRDLLTRKASNSLPTEKEELKQTKLGG
jgi:hypothetical protein